MAGGLPQGIRLRFYNHTPKQLAIGLPFHQQAADEDGDNLRGGAGEKGVEEVMGGRGGYGSGLGLTTTGEWVTLGTLITY